MNPYTVVDNDSPTEINMPAVRAFRRLWLPKSKALYGNNTFTPSPAWYELIEDELYTTAAMVGERYNLTAGQVVGMDRISEEQELQRRLAWRRTLEGM